MSKTNVGDFQKARGAIKKAVVKELGIPHEKVKVGAGKSLAVQFEHNGVEVDVVPAAKLAGNHVNQVL